MTRRIAVIGGGWAGLACAVQLAEAGRRVCVFEAARQLGGRARRLEAHGHLLDNGQHILLGAYRETLRVMRLAGAAPERLLQRHPLQLDYPSGGLRLRLPRLPAPLHLVAGLLSARGCSAGEKFAAARFMRALQADAYRVDERVTVAELLDRHRQHGNIRRYLWEALCLAALNTAPDKASAQIFANVLRDSLGGSREDTDLLLPNADLGQVFPDAAARFITRHAGEIRLSARVDSVVPLLAGADEAFAQVVIAVAPQHAAPLLQALPETGGIAAMLGGYDFEPIATVYLGYPGDVRLPFPMLGLEPGRHGQWVFDRGQLGGAAGVMGFVLSAHGAWNELGNDRLAATLHKELQDTLQKHLPPPLWQKTIRERRATFSCRPGLQRPPSRTPRRGLWLAGDYVSADYPATLEGAVRSGVAAALDILAG